MSNPLLSVRVTPIMLAMLQEAAIRDHKPGERISVSNWCWVVLLDALKARPDFKEIYDKVKATEKEATNAE